MIEACVITGLRDVASAEAGAGRNGFSTFGLNRADSGGSSISSLVLSSTLESSAS
jgi:hypothetical protein